MTLRILFLPHGRRRAYFDRLLQQGVAERGWQIAAMGPARDRSSYPYVREDRNFVPLPDFANEAARGVGADEDTVRMIADAEKQSNQPVGRLVLASERDIGRGFAVPFFHFAKRSEAKAVLEDNTLPERIVAAMFAFVARAFDAFRPDIVVSGNMAAPHHLAAAMIARQRGIPVLIGRPSKVHPDRSFWTDDLSMLNAQADQAARGGAGDEQARSYIRAFRDKPRTIAYIARTWRVGASSTWLKQHRFFAELAYLKLKFALTGGTGARPRPLWSSIADHYRTEWLAVRQRNLFQRPEPNALADMRYVYLAYHKEPELAINYQAPTWHNQYETAAKVAASLPYGVRLVVREHRFNRGRRPTRFYRDLMALPNVILADPFDNQFKYIANASLIVTDNGSTGWEGILFKKPVITLDRTFYDAAGLTHAVREPAQLAAAVLRLLSSPHAAAADWDDRLAAFVSAEFTTSIPDDETGFVANVAAIEQAAARQTAQRHAAE